MNDKHPEAAQAATEVGVGVDDAPETLGGIVLLGVIVVAVIAAIAALVGYYS